MNFPGETVGTRSTASRSPQEIGDAVEGVPARFRGATRELLVGRSLSPPAPPPLHALGAVVENPFFSQIELRQDPDLELLASDSRLP